MSRTVKEQMERLKAAFPGKYVSIDVNVNSYSHTGGEITVDYSAYTEDHSHAHGQSIDDAVEQLLRKRDSQPTQDPEEAIAQIEQITALANEQIETATQPTPENEPK